VALVTRTVTLSARLMLTLGGGLLALALAIGIAAHQGTSRVLDNALHDKANSLARQLGIVARDALLVYDYGTLERYVEDLAATPDLRYLEVRSVSGENAGSIGYRKQVTGPQHRARQSTDRGGRLHPRRGRTRL
jgi:hypothetical protein